METRMRTFAKLELNVGAFQYGRIATIGNNFGLIKNPQGVKVAEMAWDVFIEDLQSADCPPALIQQKLTKVSIIHSCLMHTTYGNKWATEDKQTITDHFRLMFIMFQAVISLGKYDEMMDEARAEIADIIEEGKDTGAMNENSYLRTFNASKVVIDTIEDIKDFAKMLRNGDEVKINGDFDENKVFKIEVLARRLSDIPYALIITTPTIVHREGTPRTRPDTTTAVSPDDDVEGEHIVFRPRTN